MAVKYFDYNASTPLDPRVLAAMYEWYSGPPANPGSRTHVFGRRAKAAVESARHEIAQLIGAQADEVCFTSGATESDNLAILGLAAVGDRTGRKHLISTAIEHKAVLQPLVEMRRRGFEVELAPVTSGGDVDPAEIRKRLRPDTLLVSVMHANNETGIVQPVQEIAELVAGTAVLFHTDAAQTFGKEVDSLRCLPYDLLSISGHKIYGPQGIGAVCVRRRHGMRPSLTPLMFGGGQERGLRPGTLPVAQIIGLGRAAELAQHDHACRRIAALRVRTQLLADLRAIEHEVNGDQLRCQPHVLNVSFPQVDSEALMLAVREELALSNGAACTSDRYGASHVLAAMGLTPERIASAVRISWGPGVTEFPTSVLREAILHLR